MNAIDPYNSDLDPIDEDLERLAKKRARAAFDRETRRLMHALYWRVAFLTVTVWLMIGAFGIAQGLGVGWPSTLLNALAGPGLLLLALVQAIYFIGVWFEKWLDDMAKDGK